MDPVNRHLEINGLYTFWGESPKELGNNSEGLQVACRWTLILGNCPHGAVK